jgi:hypothetical protein
VIYKKYLLFLFSCPAVPLFQAIALYFALLSDGNPLTDFRVNFKFPESVNDKRSAYRVLVRRTDGKSPLRSPRRRWEYKIKVAL